MKLRILNFSGNYIKVFFILNIISKCFCEIIIKSPNQLVKKFKGIFILFLSNLIQVIFL